jgi:hypothetical protein
LLLVCGSWGLGLLSKSVKQCASDLKKSLELQKEDERDLPFVRKEVELSKKCEQDKLKKRGKKSKKCTQ